MLRLTEIREMANQFTFILIIKSFNILLQFLKKVYLCKPIIKGMVVGNILNF